MSSSGSLAGKSDRPGSGIPSIRKPRPNTTPALIGSRREPTSLRIVRGLDGSQSRMSVLQSTVTSLRDTTTSDDCDSVMVDEEVVESAATTPVKAAPLPVKTAVERPSTAAVSWRPRRINLGRKELLGKGAFGVVYRAMDMETNRIIAVKEIPLCGGADKIRSELALMQKLDHPNIVKFLGEHIDENNNLRIYMEYVPGGSISSILHSFGPLRESQAAAYTRQILTGLQYLHDRRIAHRDLKGANCFCSTDGTVKLGDFGASKELATEANSIAGTMTHIAPEVVRGSGHGLPADIWSLAATVIEMLTGKPPFHDCKNQYALMMRIAECTESMAASMIPEKASPAAKAFLRRCLVPEPSKRATCAELLKDPWITAATDGPELAATATSAAESVSVVNYEPPPSVTSATLPTTSVTAAGDTFRGAAAASVNPMQSFSEDL